MLIVFFFSSRRRHTRFKCDWSSDVCSSDLISRRLARPAGRVGRVRRDGQGGAKLGMFSRDGAVAESAGGGRDEIGRGAGRGRGEISGGAGSFKKKKRGNRCSRMMIER